MAAPGTLIPRPNRLPNLFEVLNRQTLPPVDLFSFYIYMRDQQRSVDYLDFWLDVAQHMSLCRHFVRELRRSVALPGSEKDPSKRSSLALEQLGDIPDPGGPSSDGDEKGQNQRLSAFLRSNNSGFGSKFSSRNSVRSRSSNERNRRPSFSSPLESHSHSQSQSQSPAHTVTRADIRSSAERLLYTYLLRDAEREIVLPQHMLSEIARAIEVDGRDDPEVFDEAKDYVFQAMERDAYPGFLRAKALGNLVPPSAMLRLVLGLLSLFGAFWAGFALIFLDYPRTTRAWLTIPFVLGVYCLCAHQYALDPIIALAGFSEYTFMSFARLREPYVKKLLRKRAMTVLGVTLLICIALLLIYVLVPGKRL